MNKSFWEKKRVLITGHTGFKGSWLSLLLKKLGSTICGISLENKNNSFLFSSLDLENKIDFHHIQDINHKDKIQDLIEDFKPEIVFHLAAQSLVRNSYKEPLITWRTNVMGSLNILESLKKIKNNCVVIMVTTDKVYQNKELTYEYLESDPLGGDDPYSASKASAEIAIASWRKSFCGDNDWQINNLKIATVRSGNVIGGGDWAEDRIVPDAIRSLIANKPIEVRNPYSERPWQHVLDPLNGYMSLAELLYLEAVKDNKNELCTSFNFGPVTSSNKNVALLVEEILLNWKGTWIDKSGSKEPHEAKLLHLAISKAQNKLGWIPVWGFSKTVEKTVLWYKNVHQKVFTSEEACIKDIEEFFGLLDL